eukprot:scaffold10818_cov22-Cyclotella_meneghiniana.AAC.4
MCRDAMSMTYDQISELKAMNDEQNCPLGPISDSDEAIEKMKRIVKMNKGIVIKDSIMQPLGYRKISGVARADGGLFRELLVDFGFGHLNYPMNPSMVSIK